MGQALGLGGREMVLGKEIIFPALLPCLFLHFTAHEGLLQVTRGWDLPGEAL